ASSSALVRSHLVSSSPRSVRSIRARRRSESSCPWASSSSASRSASRRRASRLSRSLSVIWALLRVRFRPGRSPRLRRRPCGTPAYARSPRARPPPRLDVLDPRLLGDHRPLSGRHRHPQLAPALRLAVRLRRVRRADAPHARRVYAREEARRHARELSPAGGPRLRLPVGLQVCLPHVCAPCPRADPLWSAPAPAASVRPPHAYARGPAAGPLRGPACRLLVLILIRERVLCRERLLAPALDHHAIREELALLLIALASGHSPRRGQLGVAANGHAQIPRGLLRVLDRTRLAIARRLARQQHRDCSLRVLRAVPQRTPAS